MIKNKYLNQVAEIEGRPKKNKIYPVGTIIIQISATNGQVLFLREDKMIEEKYAVILPTIEPYYLYSVIKKTFPFYFAKKRETLNFKVEELQNFSLPIHQDLKRQRLIGQAMRLMSGKEDFY